ALYAFVPALDDAAGAEREYEGITAVLARIELLAVGEPAGVVNLHLLPRRGGLAVADSEFLDDQSAGCGRGAHRSPFLRGSAVMRGSRRMLTSLGKRRDE